VNPPLNLAGKRVLFVFCSFELGGAERQGLHLARHLQGLGCDVHAWSTSDGPGLVLDACRQADIPCEVRRFRWPCRKSSLARDGWRFLRALRRIRPDVILSYTTGPNIACGMTWRWSPADICLWGQRNDGDVRGDAVTRYAFRRVSGIICNAAHEVDMLREALGASPAPVSVVHSGVLPGAAQRSREEWRAELEIAPETVVVTMLANFRPVKDHATLLRAWGRVLASMPEGTSPPRLLLAGAPLQSHASVRRAVEEDDSHGGTIRILGQVRDVWGLLGAGDIGVLASEREGLSSAVLEYMASGLPVVACDLPGNREALGDANAQQFFPSGDTKTLADRVTQLILHRDQRLHLGQTNRQRAVAQFSLERMCDETVAIIEALFERSSRNP